MLLLVAGTIYYLIRGMIGKLRNSDTYPLMILLLVLSIAGLGGSTAFYYYGVKGPADTLFAVIGTLFSILFPVIALYSYLHWAPVRRPTFKGFDIRRIFTMTIRIEHVPMIASCMLLLVVITSAQFHPWYIAWILPFSLTSGTPYWSWSTLLLFTSLQSNYYAPWEF
jgi:hypothetical protein